MNWYYIRFQGRRCFLTGLFQNVLWKIHVEGNSKHSKTNSPSSNYQLFASWELLKGGVLYHHERLALRTRFFFNLLYFVCIMYFASKMLFSMSPSCTRMHTHTYIHTYTPYILYGLNIHMCTIWYRLYTYTHEPGNILNIHKNRNWLTNSQLEIWC